MLQLKLSGVWVGKDKANIEVRNLVCLTINGYNDACRLLYRTEEGVREQLITLTAEARKEIEKKIKYYYDNCKCGQGGILVKKEGEYAAYLFAERPAFQYTTEDKVILEYGDHTVAVELSKLIAKQRDVLQML